MKATKFKSSELGPIPVDWEVKRLGEVVNILDNRRVPLCESQRKSGTFPYCGANGIVDYIDRYEFDEEAILIAEDGGNFSDFATRSIAYKMSGKYWVNNHAHVLTAKAGYALDYLLFHLSHKDITDLISGGTRAKLTRGQLENIIISLPPLAEQRRIARALSDVDELIFALGKLIEKKRNIKTGAMQELLTGKTRLPGFGANSLRSNHSHAEAQRGRGIEFKQTELGPIPVDWEVMRIDQCGDVVTGSTPPRGVSELWGGSFSWISAKDFKGKYIISSEEKVTEAGKKYCRTLPENSVLVTCIASIGLNAIAKRPCATNQQINAVACRGCDYEYFYYQCCFNESRLRKMAGQTAVPIIGKGQFEEFTIALPKEIKEQRAIAAVLSDIDAEIAALEADRAKYESIKQGMMQELLTGKTRLKGDRNEGFVG